MKKFIPLLLLLSGIALASCSWISGESDAADLRLLSINKLESNGTQQGFELGLKLINPTDQPLIVKGLVFDLELEGYKLISGVKSAVPVINPYSEADFTARADITLISSLRFFNELMAGPKTRFKYQFRARIDIDTWWPKSVVVKRDGEIMIMP